MAVQETVNVLYRQVAPGGDVGNTRHHCARQNLSEHQQSAIPVTRSITGYGGGVKHSSTHSETWH